MENRMARKCPVCEHTNREDIEIAMKVPRSSARTVALEFGLSRDQVQRHKAHVLHIDTGIGVNANDNGEIAKLKAAAQGSEGPLARAGPATGHRGARDAPASGRRWRERLALSTPRIPALQRRIDRHSRYMPAV